jgi:hypothetical protein
MQSIDCTILLAKLCFVAALVYTSNCFGGLGFSTRYIGWIQGPAIFCSLLWLQSATEHDPQHFFVGCLLVWLVWDGGVIATATGVWPMICLGMHRFGVVFVFVFVFVFQSKSEECGWLSPLFFSWLWSIHSFGFGSEKMKLPRGSIWTWSFLGIFVFRHFYGVCSVCCYHLYLSHLCQRGLGYNPQTLATTLLLLVRLLVKSDWTRIDFSRRMEFPGYCLTTFAHLFGCPAISFTVSFYVFLGIYSHKILTFKPVPKEYVFSARIEELLVNLEEEAYLTPVDKRGADKKEEEMVAAIDWWDEHEEWDKKWPLHKAALVGDLEAITRLLADKELDVDVAMADFRAITPLGVACHFGRFDVVVSLLKMEANPYCDCLGQPAIVAAKKHAELAVLCAEINGLALKASPPECGINPSFQDKALAVMERF